MQPYLVPLILVAVVVVAYLLGRYVSKSMRMPESGWKVSLIVVSIGIAVLILATSWPPKQGIDLKGGVILIYEVDEAMTQRSANQESDSSGDLSTVDMPGLIQALSRRINPGGVQEIVVRSYGDNQVEIIIPDASDVEVEAKKKLITTGGFLKFQIVANQRDHLDLWKLADQPSQTGQYQIRDEDGRVVGQWAKLSRTENSSREEPVYRVDPPQAKSRVVRGYKEVLMVVDPNFDMQGSDLRSVRKGYQDVSPAVFFDTTASGARLMDELTGNNLPDTTSGHFSLLGIVMDGDLISAPRINSRISTSGLIEGQFTEEEVDLLVNVLRAGRLPAVLTPEPISQNKVSPLLGSDTIRQGKVAIIVSLVTVLAFMLIYYRFAGFVACLALLFNLIFILALMIFVGAAFSLPGMAALVLTVGMSVDANVLIFERIGEEKRNGAALRMAIRNGFGRATRTIVDANVTTLITAVVLYLIGTEQLRAFAVALILGILMTLFTAIFCSRVVFDLAEKSGGLRKLTIPSPLGKVNFDLFGKRRLAGLLSVTLIVIGLAAVGVRGNRIFDIDFLGGTSVQFILNDPMEIADARERVAKLREDGIVENVSLTEVEMSDGQGRSYRVDTSLPEMDGDNGDTKIQRVQNAIVSEFKGGNGVSLLQTHSLSYSPPNAVTAAESEANDDLPDIGVDGTSTNQDAEIETFPSTETPATDGETAPGEDDSSRLDLPPDSLLAFSEAAVVAQAALLQTGEDASDATASGDVANTVTLDAASLRSESNLTFDEAINEDTLRSIILETATEIGMAQPDLVFSNPFWDEASSQPFEEWNVNLSATPEQAQILLGALKDKLDSTPVWLAANQIGGSVAGDKTRMAVAAVLGSLFGIIAYIWIRFQHVTYGLAAVAALVHDVLITLGAIALSFYLKDYLSFLMIDEFKISLPVVAAFLTIIGYSLNDTIVVFDRIREVKGRSPKLTAEIINKSINQTLSRTLLTSFTTLLAVVILYAIGGQGIHAFAFALMVGVVAGTYSSIFVACPVLLWMSKLGDVSEPNAAAEVVAKS